MNFTLPFSISFLYSSFLWLLLLLPAFVLVGWPNRNAPDVHQRWVALGVRLLVLLGLILGLAGARLGRPVDRITTVFVLDVSDSMTSAQRGQAEAFLRDALRDKPEDDQGAIVLFGGDALVERLPNAENTLSPLAAIPLQNATNLENALRLALALLPNEGGGRIVLLSDGQQTAGAARRIANIATARQVEVSALDLSGLSNTTEGDVLVGGVKAPTSAREGQTLPLAVEVNATQATAATLHLLVDGSRLESREVRLNAGRNQFTFNILLEDSGFHNFRVEVETADDQRPQNNWGAAFTTVYGAPHILVVATDPTESRNLVAALNEAQMQTTTVDPDGIPPNLSALANYEAVVLVNVPATDLPEMSQDHIAQFVRELGRGLVMIGGPESYGAGSYLRTPIEKALPVDMNVRNRNREPNIALVLAVDKSGSMGSCHCDDPDLRQQYNRIPSGLPKIDIAKEAIFQATQVLGEVDYMGVVAFDTAARWAIETAPLANNSDIEGAIGGLMANGQTNMFAGLVAAEESLRGTSAKVKHIILLTDGWSHSGDYDELIARLAEEGITLSVVAAGGGSAEYLGDLAEQGGGKYYPAPSMADVPQIFLKETVRAVGNYIIEEPFVPVVTTLSSGGGPTSPILQGLDFKAAPPLRGYNGTTPKDAARVPLLTPRGDPLLATWQYGLGRSAAWTSDLSGRWGQDWLTWGDYPQFAAQLVGWTLPQPNSQEMVLSASGRGNQLDLRAVIQDEAGQPQNFLTVKGTIINADGEAQEIDLPASGPGRYEATIPVDDEGVYLVQVTGYEGDGDSISGTLPLASQTSGIVLPYSAEYADFGQDTTLLTDLTAVTGGQLLTSNDPSQAFAHNLALGRQTQPLWPYLLLLAALLFPLDVALRRLRLGQREWAQARTWVAARLPRSGGTVTEEKAAPVLLNDLFAARQRARHRQTNEAETETGSSSINPSTTLPQIKSPPETSQSTGTPSASSASSVPSAPTPPATPATSETDETDTLARLRAAKKRLQDKK